MNLQQVLEKSGKLLAGRYKLERQLGTGGMGAVYLASDEMLDSERVALKVLHPHLLEDEKLTKRFLREVQLTRKVTHPNVVRTFDAGKAGKLFFYTMEFVAGETLQSKFLESPAEADAAVRILVQICEGLAAIHESGIIHRDLKPGNVMIRPDGTVKIADFGIARQGVSTLTTNEETLGSALYMAPEIWEGQPIGMVTDIYALGITLYELVTGVHPFAASSCAEVMRRHLEITPVEPKVFAPALPGWFNQLILRMLAKSPSGRPSSVSEVLKFIEEWHGGSSDDSIVENSSAGQEDELQRATSEAISSLVAELGPLMNASTVLTRKDSCKTEADPGSTTAKLGKAQLSGKAAKHGVKAGKKIDSRKILFGALRAVLAVGLTAALWLCFTGFLGEELLYRWIGVREAPSAFETLSGFIAPVISFIMLLALPVLLFSLITTSFWRAVAHWFQSAGILLLIGLVLLNVRCYQAGFDALQGENGIAWGRVQWVTETTMRNLLEVASFGSWGTRYRLAQPVDDDELDRERIMNFKGGLTSPRPAFGAGSGSSELLYIEDDENALGSVLNHFSLLVPYLLFVSVLFMPRPVGISRKALLSGRTVAFASVLLVLLLLENLLVINFLDLMSLDTEIWKIGPFFQEVSSTQILLAALNWAIFTVFAIIHRKSLFIP